MPWRSTPMLESLIKVISPSWALKRAENAIRLERLYEAAKAHAQHKRIVDGRRSPDSIMEQTRDELTIWARHLDENYDIVTGALSNLSDTASRCCFEPKLRRVSDGQLDDDKNGELQELFEEWRDEADWSGSSKWPDFSHNIARSWLRDGEVFLNHILGAETSSGVPYQIEALESDFLPFSFTVDVPRIIHGVEKMANGKPIAFRFWKSHPSNSGIHTLTLPSDLFRDTLRVPVDQVSHVKLTRRLNQTRGVSVLHSVIHRLDNLNEYEQSEQIKSRVNACLSAAITRQPSFAEPVVNTDTNEIPYEMQAGQVWQLNAGESVETVGNASPNPIAVQFRNMMLRGVSAGIELKASTLSRDYSEGSYSSQRQELVEAKPAEDRLRESFAAQAYKPIWRRFVTAAVLSGRFSLQGTEPRSQFDVEISGVVIPWIDMAKEVSADAEATREVFKSHSQVIRERGGTPAKVFREALADAERLNEIQKLRQEVLPTPAFTQGAVEALDESIAPTLPENANSA